MLYVTHLLQMEVYTLSFSRSAALSFVILVLDDIFLHILILRF